MISMESGQSRAAILMHAARRSHFAAKIEKYEAKGRQEQKLRALQRETQKRAMALMEQHPINLQGKQPSFPKGVASTEQVAVRLAQKHEREDSPEQKTISEHKDIVGERHTIRSELQRTSSSVLKMVPRGSESSHLTSAAPAGKVFHCETEPSPQATVCIDLKPSPTIEVNITAIAAALKVRIKAADMGAPMQGHAFQCARECLDTTDKLHCKRIAYTLKKEFDKVYGPAWHCIVGTSFGSYVTHSLGGFVYFSLEKVSVLLFKTMVELALH